MIKYFIIKLFVLGLITGINLHTFAQSGCNSFSGNSIATISATDSLLLTSSGINLNIATNITNFSGGYSYEVFSNSIGMETGNGYETDSVNNSIANISPAIFAPLDGYLGNNSYFLVLTDGCNNTLTTNSINVTITKGPCIPIVSAIISDTIFSTITLVGNNIYQNPYQLYFNTSIDGGNFISFLVYKNGIPQGSPIESTVPSLTYVSTELNYGIDSGAISYFYVFSNGCSTVTSNSLSVNVSGIPFVPCTNAPTIYQFGLNGTVSDSVVVAQCSSQQLFLSVDELSTGPNDPNGRRFVYYQSGNVIGESYNNSFTINTSTTGTFSYSASAISNCGTTVSALRIVTIIPDSTSCDSSNNVGGNISCSIPTIMGNGNPLLTATIFGTVNYSASATTTDGNITSFIWYKTNYPQSLNDSTPLFGSSNSFTLLYATVSDTGSYAVTAQNSCGSTSTPFYFHISIDTVQPSGYVPVLPAVTSSLLGGDFTIPYTSPSFVLQVDSTGDTLSLQWANVVGVNTNAGDSYCVLISQDSTFSKTYQICNLTSPGLILTQGIINTINAAFNARIESTSSNIEKFFFEVTPVINNIRASYSAPTVKGYRSSTLTDLSFNQVDNQIAKVYPSPNDGSFTIIGSGNVTITNILGIPIQSFESNGIRNINGLVKGIYIVSVNGKNIKVIVE